MHHPTPWSGLALLAVAAGTAGATPAMRTVKLPKIGIALQIPASWSGADTALRFDAHARGRSALLTIQRVDTSLTLTRIGANFVKAEKQQLVHATVTSQDVELPAGPAVEVTIRYQSTWNRRSTRVTHLVYSFKHGKHAYVVDYSAPSKWMTNNRRTLAASIRSFAFLDSHKA